ncbi:OR3A1 protein, partial [Polypterus senegalus]
MVHISCTDDPKYLAYVSSCSFVLGVGPLVLILSSYSRIVQEALQISSVEGKKKVFSTCVTHLLVVGTFYVPILLSYTLPGLGIPLSTEIYNTMDMIGIIIPPMMNPIIYSFRNNEIKSGIYKLFKAMKTSPDAGRIEKRAGVQLSTEAYNTMVIVGNVVPPMLNPVIYSFRNKEIKNNIVKLLTMKRITPANSDH